jgi:hypothetical protein
VAAQRIVIMMLSPLLFDAGMHIDRRAAQRMSRRR